ncbi:hypothetical protein OSB04_025591 [Centaurea solstitialis]|uniref:Uncharacterized protein n=1 Tax=Centaurea solstitialis TaxID=347529 RepID=A0AA38WD83_9ASTR|nr:hypothetical protein OSB04_025591 [Centaurea solstitialis]
MTFGYFRISYNYSHNERRPLKEGCEMRELTNIHSLCQVVQLMDDDEGNWNWELDSTTRYSLASIRRAINDMGLRRCGPPTCWNYFVPTKIHVSNRSVTIEKR